MFSTHLHTTQLSTNSRLVLNAAAATPQAHMITCTKIEHSSLHQNQNFYLHTVRIPVTHVGHAADACAYPHFSVSFLMMLIAAVSQGPRPALSQRGRLAALGLNTWHALDACVLRAFWLRVLPPYPFAARLPSSTRYECIVSLETCHTMFFTHFGCRSSRSTLLQQDCLAAPDMNT